VVKIPRWAFEKFRDASPSLGTQMKSVGEVMAIGRTFKEALQKGLRGLEIGASGFSRDDLDDDRIQEKLLTPDPDRIFYVKRALDLGWPQERIHQMTGIDPWFLDRYSRSWIWSEPSGPAWIRKPCARRSGWVLRRADRLPDGVGEAGIRPCGAGRHPPRLQARRHVRGRVRVPHAVSVLDL